MRTPSELQRRANSIAWKLYMQDYNRTYFPGICPDAELTAEAYVVLVVDRFKNNVYGGGFDGFETNTDCVYSHFLPIALAAIGATQFATIARTAIEQKRVSSDGETNVDAKFFACKENLRDLLLSYIDRHRDRLPDGENVMTEAVWEEQKRRWRSDAANHLDAAWSNKERPCPKCGTIFVSKFARGACPNCKHVFIAGSL